MTRSKSGSYVLSKEAVQNLRMSGNPRGDVLHDVCSSFCEIVVGECEEEESAKRPPKEGAVNRLESTVGRNVYIEAGGAKQLHRLFAWNVRQPDR